MPTSVRLGPRAPVRRATREAVLLPLRVVQANHRAERTIKRPVPGGVACVAVASVQVRGNAAAGPATRRGGPPGEGDARLW
ncbi:hypothetical protein [Arthrobacter sp. B0490]|uniref:hypothetical protein n=1 Tax=Arthrobacter sp. B0490 TaxID=2058891 RepID=UPI0011B0ADA1|nr:hypothetical protein [Arthrobacter sp. B0490]